MSQILGITGRFSSLVHTQRSFATAAKRSEPAQSVKSQSRSLKEILRRKRDKEQLFGLLHSKVDNDDERTIVLNEGWKKASEINWLFNGYDLTPSGSAFKNLHLRGLQHFSSVKPSSNKTSESKASEYKSYLVGQEVSADQFEELKYDVTEQMGEAPYLFLEDGTIGAAQWGEVVARVFTDSADAALFFRNLLNPHKFRDLSSEGPDKSSTQVIHDEVSQTQLKVYVATSAAISDPAKYGLKGQNAVVFNNATGDLLIIGSQSTQAWKSAVYDGAAHSFTSYPEAAVPLYNSRALTKNDQRTILLNADSSAESTNDVIWTDVGIARAFKNSKSSDANTSAQPQNVVIVVDSSSAPTASKLSASQAAKLFAVGYNGSKTSTPFYSAALARMKESGQKIVNNFQKLVQENNVNVYMVNKKGLNNEQLNSLVDAVTAGGADAQSGTAGASMTPISSLSNYKGALGAGAPKSFDDEIAALMKSNPESGSLAFNDRVQTTKEQEEAEKVSLRKYLERNWVPGVDFASYLEGKSEFNAAAAKEFGTKAVTTPEGATEFNTLVRDEIGQFLSSQSNVQIIKDKLKKVPERLRYTNTSYVLP